MRVWSLAELTSVVWNRPFVGAVDAVVFAVTRLRFRLARVTKDLGIVPVRGVGYRLALLSTLPSPYASADRPKPPEGAEVVQAAAGLAAAVW